MRCAAKSGWCSSPLTCSRRSEEHTSELQSQSNLVCRLLLEKKKYTNLPSHSHWNSRDFFAFTRVPLRYATALQRSSDRSTVETHTLHQRSRLAVVCVYILNC